MKIYTILAKDKDDHTYLPELTASDFMAKERKSALEKMGYSATIVAYEVKTQGKNFYHISTPIK